MNKKDLLLVLLYSRRMLFFVNTHLVFKVPNGFIFQTTQRVKEE